MAIPLVGGFAAAFVAGFSAFLASRGAWILAGLGVGFTAMKGMQILLGFVVGDMVAIIGALQSGGGSLEGFSHVGLIMLQFAAYMGLFDGLNILLGGYMASYGLIATRVVMRRLTG